MAVDKTKSNPVFFGGFICAIGYGFLFIALYSQFDPRTDGGLLSNPAATLSLLLLLFATIASFLAVNMEPDQSKAIRRAIGSRSITSRLAGAILQPLLLWGIIALALMAAVVAGHAAQAFANQEAQAQGLHDFAMAIPLGEAASGAGPGTSLDGGDVATIYWRSDLSTAGHDDGFLKMLVGAFLTILFGVIYPFVARGGEKQELGFVEKLVVPILTAVLFGVGASEQANAENAEKNVELATRGQLPVWGLPAEEVRVTVLQQGATPSQTEAILRDAIFELYERLEGEVSDLERRSDEDRAAMARIIMTLNQTHRRLGISNEQARAEARSLVEEIRTDYATTERRVLAQLDMLNSADDNFRESFETLSRTQLAQVCQLNESLLRQEQLQREGNMLIGDLEKARIEREDRRRSRNIFQKVGDGLFGEKVRNSDLTEVENANGDLGSPSAEFDRSAKQKGSAEVHAACDELGAI